MYLQLVVFNALHCIQCIVFNALYSMHCILFMFLQIHVNVYILPLISFVLCKSQKTACVKKYIKLILYKLLVFFPQKIGTLQTVLYGLKREINLQMRTTKSFQ